MKKLVILAVIVGAAYFVWTKLGNFSPSGNTPQNSDGPSGGSAVRECIGMAERASSQLSSAAMMVGRPPVDQSAWRDAESSASSAISAAESHCGSGTTDAERKAVDEVRAACSTMRTLLSELSSAASGSGGATTAVQRQEEIDSRLAAAKAALP